jgi:hypothetical protein
MIPYEELVAALDRYVAKNGGTPQSVRASASSFSSQPAAEDVPMGGFDEPNDPDLAGGMHPGLASHGGEEDATHVGDSPLGAAPPPPVASGDDHSNEIDIGDVLADDEL